LAKTFWETSVTLYPVTSATVKVESTSGSPNPVMGGVVVIKVDGGGVLGEQGEPDVARCGDRASQGMLVDVTHLEVL
jgi:hypothetical protein